MFVIYGFGLCWLCTMFGEIYGMKRKMTKRRWDYFGFGDLWAHDIEGDGNERKRKSLSVFFFFWKGEGDWWRVF